MTTRTVIEVARRGRDGDYAGASEVAALQADVSTLQLGQTRTNLRSEGLSLDGTTDETAALQAVINAASNGDILVLDERAQLRITSQVLISGKQVSFEGYGDAAIKCTTPLTVPLVKFQSVPNDTFIRGLEIIGAETAYVGAVSDRYALDVVGSPHFKIERLTTSGTSRGIRINTSNYTTLRTIKVTGLTPYGTYIDEVNYHTALHVDDSDYAIIDGLYGRDIGSALLSGGGSMYGQVSGLLARNCMDNAVYISSGEGWQAVTPQIINDSMPTTGYGGVKFRGDDHRLIGGYIKNTTAPIVMSDAGATADPDGYGGGGSSAIGTHVNGSYNNGASIEQEYAAPPRDMTIAFCVFENCVQGGNTGHSSVRATHGTGHQFVGNQIINQAAGRAGISLNGAAATIVSNVTISMNMLRGLGITGIWAAYSSGVVISQNVLRDIAGNFGILSDNSTANQIFNNHRIGTVGTVAGIRSGSGDTNARIMDNPTLDIQNLGTGGVVHGNANGNPTVAANATDLATAIALVNDIKAKLQAQKVFG